MEALRPNQVYCFTHKNMLIDVCNIKNHTAVPKQDSSGIQASETEAEIPNNSAQFSSLGNASSDALIVVCVDTHKCFIFERVK